MHQTNGPKKVQKEKVATKNNFRIQRFQQGKRKRQEIILERGREGL